MSLDPVDNIVNYKMGIIYWNTQDSRFLVPKRERGMGYTLNFAHKHSAILLIFIAVLFVVTVIYLNSIKNPKYI